MSHVTISLAFDRQCAYAGLPAPTPEYQFAKALAPDRLAAIGQEKPRRWAIDWAFVDHRLALEVEGGLFVQGRHSRGAGAAKDMDKYNALALLGWRLLRVTPREVRSGAALTLVERALRLIPAPPTRQERP